MEGRDKNIAGGTSCPGGEESKEPILVSTTRVGAPDNMHLVVLYNFYKPVTILFASHSFPF